ncbi:hypothetical protein [Lysobacter gummosus]|uniref:hypothetical protein n=1 Tax=Lysobacter gummosus TaxID=262324 RepID=UPI003625A334
MDAAGGVGSVRQHLQRVQDPRPRMERGQRQLRPGGDTCEMERPALAGRSLSARFTARAHADTGGLSRGPEWE